MPSQTVTLPAPTGGWNAKDSLAEMSPIDAPVMTNWFPSTTEVILRNGYSNWATGLPGQVETIMAYSGGATDKMFAISNTAIYDITAGGAVGAAVVTGLTNARWQYINVATTGGNYLTAANGVDSVQLFDGTTWSNPSISGVTSSTLNNPCLFKNRVWFIQVSTLKAWYLPIQSVSGTANSLDMSAFCQLGGKLIAVATWTIDAGTGVDDYLAFVTNKGEVLVWEGTDVADPATWSLKGIWRLGTPIGSRCLFKFQGDLLYICQDGVVPMSQALQTARTNPQTAITYKIQQAISVAISAYSAIYGWQLLYFPKENQIWLNVPLSGPGYQQQYVMNTISGAWCNYTGWNANCWEIFQDNPYFGGNTIVGKAWDTLKDNSANINGGALQAFNGFRTPGLLKRFTMVKPIFRVGGPTSVGVGFNIDFDLNNNVPAIPATSSFTLGQWDVSKWDNSTWGDLMTSAPWVGVHGVGNYGAPYVNISSPGVDVRWESTVVVYERGGVI